MVKDFEQFAQYIIIEFKDKVKYWTTINEQSIIVQYWTQKCYILLCIGPAFQTFSSKSGVLCMDAKCCEHGNRPEPGCSIYFFLPLQTTVRAEKGAFISSA